MPNRRKLDPDATNSFLFSFASFWPPTQINTFDLAFTCFAPQLMIGPHHYDIIIIIIAELTATLYFVLFCRNYSSSVHPSSYIDRRRKWTAAHLHIISSLIMQCKVLHFTRLMLQHFHPHYLVQYSFCPLIGTIDPPIDPFYDCFLKSHQLGVVKKKLVIN